MDKQVYQENFLQLLRSTDRDQVQLAFEIAQGIPDFQPLIEAYRPLVRVSGVVTDANDVILPAQVLGLNRLEELSVGTIAQLPDIIWELHRLRKLTIHNMTLKNIPEGLAKLSNLENLCFFNAPFEGLPDGLIDLKKLRRIEIVASVEVLPKQICKVHQLQELILCRNQITQLPAKIGWLSNLEMLEVSEHQQLMTLPEEIGQLTHLTYLNMSRSQITVLPSTIGKLDQLTYLSINSAALKHFPPELNQLQKLEYIDMVNTLIPDEEIVALLKQLPHCEIRR